MTILRLGPLLSFLDHRIYTQRRWQKIKSNWKKEEERLLSTLSVTRLCSTRSLTWAITVSGSQHLSVSIKVNSSSWSATLSVSYLFVILVFCYLCEDLWKLSALNLHSHLVGLPGKCARIRMPPNSFQMASIFVYCFEEMKHGIIQSYPISVIIHFTRISLLCWFVASFVFQLSGRHGIISFAI